LTDKDFVNKLGKKGSVENRSLLAVTILGYLVSAMWIRDVYVPCSIPDPTTKEESKK
jgi:hypothetical protein